MCWVPPVHVMETNLYHLLSFNHPTITISDNLGSWPLLLRSGVSKKCAVTLVSELFWIMTISERISAGLRNADQSKMSGILGLGGGGRADCCITLIVDWLIFSEFCRIAVIVPPYLTKFRRTKLPKFSVGANIFFCRKILSAEIFVRQNFVR